MSLNDKAASALKRELARAFPERGPDDAGHGRLADALTKPTHTPGKWTFAWRGPHLWMFALTEDGGVHETVFDTENLDAHPISLANARLIAAAPCLLSALKALVAVCPECDGTGLADNSDPTPCPWCESARAAIARAEGGGK
jgi:hypothetical protein